MFSVVHIVYIDLPMTLSANPKPISNKLARVHNIQRIN